MEGLISFRPGTFTNANCLATSLEPSKDGKRIHFKLRQGVEFHGGYGELDLGGREVLLRTHRRPHEAQHPRRLPGRLERPAARQDRGQVRGHDHPQGAVRTARPQHLAVRRRTGHLQEGRGEAGQEVRHPPHRHGPVRVHQVDAQAEDRADALRQVRRGQQALHARPVLRGDQRDPDRQRQRRGNSPARRATSTSPRSRRRRSIASRGTRASRRSRATRWTTSSWP